MKRTAKLVLPAFISISLAGLVVLVVLYYRTRGAREVTFKEESDIGVKIEDLNYADTRRGRTIWRLRAGGATRYKSRHMLVLEGIDLLFYSDDRTPFTMKAREGRFDEAKKVVYAKGGVKVTSPEGYSLETRRLRYDTARGLITSADPVVIFRRDMRVSGVGFRVEVKRGSLYIMRDVRAVISGEGVHG